MAKEEKISGRVILSTGEVLSVKNIDPRSFSCQMHLFDKDINPGQVENLRMGTFSNFSSILSSEDSNKLESTYKYIKSFLDLFILSLKDQHPQYLFDVQQCRSDDSYDVENKITLTVNLTVFPNLSQVLTNRIVDEMKNSMRGILSEVNRLIDEINSTVDKTEIGSVILCRQAGDYRHPIIHKDIGAAEFVYRLYDVNYSFHDLLEEYQIGQEYFPVIKPYKKRNRVWNDKKSIVIGTVELKSEVDKTFLLEGVYTTDKGSRTEKFRRTIQCLNDFEKENELIYEALFEKSRSGRKVVVKIVSVQNYVCIEGKNAKKYIVVSVEK